MAGMTTTTLNDLVQAAIAECKFYVEQNAVLQNYVTNYSIPHKTVDVPIMGAATVIDVTEGTDLTGTSDLATSKATITGARYAVRDYISDDVVMESPEALGALYGQAFGKAMASKLNQIIWALFDGFSEAVGTTNVDITLAIIQEARAILEKAGAPEPYTLAITPHVHEDLIAAISDSTSVNLSAMYVNSVAERGVVQKVVGCDVIIVNDLAGTTGAGEKDGADAKCGLFSRGALGVNTAFPFTIEAARDISMVGTELVGSTMFGAAELYDGYGVEVLCDNKD